VPRRVIDRGPLVADRQRADVFAARLRSTGLYERVTVERGGFTASRPSNEGELEPPDDAS
jgi:hypothetical protein